jgi:hypothetical protein
MPPLAGDDGLFVYGSLLFPQVQVALLDRVPESRPASAPGWRVAALPGRSYPGLVPGKGSAAGLLLEGLGDEDWRTLIAYEGGRYDLRPLDLHGGERAVSFVWTAGPVSPRDWEPREFAPQLPSYVEWCSAWRRSRSSGAARL